MPATPKPELGDPLKAAHPSDETLKLLSLRRSTTAVMLTKPGPTDDQLEQILQIGARVPDHRRVCPYRFVIFEDEARAEFGKTLAEAYRRETPAAEEAAIAQEAGRFLRAPVIVAVVFSPQTEHRTPVWEQTLTTGAVCQNMLIAANALGYAAQWLTEWYAYNRRVLTQIGLDEHEQIAGFVYIGSAKEDPRERQRVDARSLVSHWQNN